MSVSRTSERVVIALVAGAIINLLVAWGCLFVTPKKGDWLIRVTKYRDVHRACGWWRAPGAAKFVSAQPLATLAALPLPVTEPPAWSRPRRSEDARPVMEDARGWPLLSLTSIVFENEEGRLVCEGGFILRRRSFEVAAHDGVLALPLRPALPGFVGNTAFYGAFVFALFFARPLLRARRGLCRRCGYSLQTGSRCPECGLENSRRRRGPGGNDHQTA